MGLDKKVLVAFNGMRGAYAEQACKATRQDAITVPCSSVEEVFEKVANRSAAYGVVPIENCIAGSVSENYDLLLKYCTEQNVRIVREICLRITHCLLASPRATLQSIKRVYAHPQALAQCRPFLDVRNYLPIPMNDNGSAAAMVGLHGRIDEAAIAGIDAARNYRLNILGKDIAARNYNATRFLIIGKKQNEKIDSGKFSIAFRCAHKPGALHACLATLKKMNLTSIASRPTQDFGMYRFFVDFEGHHANKSIQNLQRKAEELCILGKYYTQYA